MKKRASSTGLLLTVLVVLGPGCNGSASGTDSGSDAATANDSSSSDTGSSSNTPPLPTAAQGEIAVAARDGTTDETFRCTAGTGDITATLNTSGSNTTLSIVCRIGTNITMDGQLMSITMMRSAIAPGTYSIASSHRVPPEFDSFGVSVAQGGMGFAVGQTASTAPDYTGTLTLDEAVAGSGGRIRGSLTITWDTVGTITNGAVRGSASRSGGLSAAFDVTQP